MPRHKKRGSGTKIVGAIVVIGVVLIAVIGWHDGLFGTTSIADINDGDIPNGTAVTIKGRLTFRLGNVHAVTSLDGGNTVGFEWSGTSPALDSVIVVRGVVSSVITLEDVSSVEVVWLLK